MKSSISTVASVLVLAGVAGAQPNYFISSSQNSSWGVSSFPTAMDAVFGNGNWQFQNFGFNPASVFQQGTQFVYIEGGNGDSTTMANYIAANQALIENWVSQGGRLIMNAAPNVGGSFPMGFGGVQLTYPSFNNSVAVVNNHPINFGPFLPVGQNYTGGSYGHATISGGGVTTIVQGSDTGTPVWAEKPFGQGNVVFGGYTFVEATSGTGTQNHFQNIIYYAATVPAPGAAGVLALGGLAAVRRRR